MNDKQPNIAQIHSYLKGELDAATMHQMEKQAQADPFLMDALEGFELSGTDQQTNFNELKARLDGRVDQKKKPVIMLWRMASIAACLLAFLTIGWFFLLKEQPAKQEKQTANVILPKAKPKADPVMPSIPFVPPATASVTAHQHVAANSLSRPLPQRITHRSPLPNSIQNPAIASLTNGVAHTQSNNPTAETITTAPVKTTIDQFVGGKITDAAGQTLPGVSLTLADGSTVTTDADGNYKIPALLAKDSVTVQMMGYNTQKVALKGTEGLNIKLSESTNSLATVVVETKAIKNPPHVQPEPLGGWKAYLEYIRQSATMPDGQTGRVKLAFFVDTNGGISNIKVIRGRSEAMNNRAIAMILNGPPWEGSSDESVKKVKLKIRFRKS